MALDIVSTIPTRGDGSGNSAQFLRVRLKTVEVPPIRDGLVLGVNAPVLTDTVVQLLGLIGHADFTVVAMDDDVVRAVVVRDVFLRRISVDVLKHFVLQHVKPFMAPGELLRMDFQLEIQVEGYL